MITWFLPKKSAPDYSEQLEIMRERWKDLDIRVGRLELNEQNMRNMARKIQTRTPREDETEAPKDLRSQILLPE